MLRTSSKLLPPPQCVVQDGAERRRSCGPCGRAGRRPTLSGASSAYGPAARCRLNPRASLTRSRMRRSSASARCESKWRRVVSVKLPDVNLLLYALDVASPHHPRARPWLEDVLSGTEPVGFAWSVLLAFLRLSTRHHLFASGIGGASPGCNLCRGPLSAPGVCGVPGWVGARRLNGCGPFGVSSVMASVRQQKGADGHRNANPLCARSWRASL